MRTNTTPKFAFFIFILYSATAFAGNYTWTGTTNTDWATGTNWNPNGTPSTNDTVTIVTHTNLPVLAANTTIKKFTMTSGTLDCNGYTLTISATATFNGGTINNGTLTCSGTSTLTFAGTTFGAAVNATGNSILLNGSKFNSTFTAVKKGTGNDNGSGGNYFSGAVTIIDSSSGNLVLSNNSSSPDTFNTTLTVASRSSGSIYLAHQGANNVFNGTVKMYSSSSGKIFSNYYGTAAYNDSIVVNSTSSGGETFGAGTGSCTLASGKTITIGTEGFDHTASGGSWGTLYLRNFVQGNATAINLTLTGSRATIKFESGCVLYGAVTVSAPAIFLDGSRFLSKVNLTYTTASGYTLTSSGGNYFGDTATIVQGNSAVVTMGGTAVDTFATYACLQNTGTTLAINNALFLGNVKFKNSLVSLSDHYYVASTGTVTIKGNATIENANSSINFGNSGGTTVLDTNCRITIPAGSGTVNLTNVVQHGSDTISIPMSAGSDVLYLNTGNVFNGPFIFNGTRILLNGTTFNGSVNILRTYNGATFDICNGGNVFNGNTVICDSVNTSNSNRKFALAGTNPDDFNANVTFKQYASGSGASTVRFYPAYTKNSTFAGNITVDGSSAIEFGANSGKIIFDGSGSQSFGKTGSYNPTVKKLQLNKSSGTVTLSIPLALSDSLILTKGVLATDTTNLLSMSDNSIAICGSDSGYVSGPVNKTGNDIFIFPLGSSSKYHPLVLFTAPSSTGDAYTAQYFHSATSISDTLDSVYISNCEYWTLKHTAGSSSVKVGLGWTADSCFVTDTTNIILAGYNGSSWTNYGIGSISNNTGGRGIINAANTTSISSGTKHTFAIATFKPVLDFIINTDTANGGDLIIFTNNSRHYNPSSKFHLSYGDTCYGCSDTVQADFKTWHVYQSSNTYSPTLFLTDLFNRSYSASKQILINPHTTSRTRLTDYPRGLYINDFIKFFGEVSVDHLEVDPNLTILGNAQKEDEILDYCQRNNFTYIVLYDLYPMINYVGEIDSRTGLSFGDELCRFISKAKNNYCIQKIGAAGATSTFFNSVISNYNSPPIHLTQDEKDVLGPYSPLFLAEASISPSDPLYRLSELIKFYARLANFNTANAANAGVDFSVGTGICSDGAKIDVLTTESEFWRIVEEQNWSLPSQKWNNIIIPLMSAMDNIKVAQAALGNDIYTEMYLAVLESVEDAAGAPCWQSGLNVPNDHIPCCDPSGALQTAMAGTIDLYIDRVLLTYVWHTADHAYNDINNTDIQKRNYTYRFLSFGENSTAANTVTQPMFNAESYAAGGASNYYGLWFADDIKNNVFTSEQTWYNDWYEDAYGSIPNLIARDNDVQPGTSHWFSSEFLQALQNNPVTFQSNSPLCTPAAFNFTYQGPINEGLKYDFWIDDGTGNIIYLSTGQDWPTYSYSTVTHTGSSISLPSVNINVVGEYVAHLKLYYPNSTSLCSYQYDSPLQVLDNSTTPSIEVYNLTSICVGTGQTILHAPSGTSYGWEYYKNSSWTPCPNYSIGPAGTWFATNRTDQDYQLFAMTQSDWAGMSTIQFRCNVNTPCFNGYTDPVTITVNPNPYPILQGSTVCNTLVEGCTINLLSIPASVTQKTWSDGSHGSSFFTTQSGNYSIKYENTGGCSWTTPFYLAKPDFGVTSGHSNALCGTTTSTSLSIDNFSSFDAIHLYKGSNLYQDVLNPNRSLNTYDFTGLTAGTYTLVGDGKFTYEDQGSNSTQALYCFTSIPIVVDDLANFVIDDVTACDNKYTSMSCGVFNAVSYVWSPIPVTTRHVVIPPADYTSATTQFTCTVTVGTCVEILSGYLTKLQVPILSSTSTDVTCGPGCNGSASVSIVSGGGASPSYSWSSGGATNTISNVCEGAYTAVVTATNGCKSDAEIVNVGATGFTCDKDINICSGQTSSSLMSSYSSGMSIAIHDDLVIDNYFILDNSEVSIDNNVSIIINPGATLKIKNGSHLFACNSTQMWKGIELSDASASLIVEGALTIIEDATAAVEGINGGSILIEDATLTRNEKSIVLNNIPNNLILREATFSCPTPLNITGHTQTHVELVNAGTIIIGDDNSLYGPNVFEDAIFGISSTRTNLTVVKSSFDITWNATPVPWSKAIFSIGNWNSTYELNVGLDAVTSTNNISINNYAAGVFAAANKANIQYNNITNCMYGIYIYGVNDVGGEVSHNEFVGCDFSSIYCKGIRASGNNFNIVDNHINDGYNSTSEYGEAGIAIFGFLTDATTALFVEDNIVNNVQVGILANFLNGFTISGNVVSFPMTLNGLLQYSGIWVGGCQIGLGKVRANQITTANTTSGNNIPILSGITLNSSSNLTIDRNLIEDEEAGIRIVSTCIPALFRKHPVEYILT